MSDYTVHRQGPARLSPYLVLGLPSTATKEQVKDAFRKLCLQYHPDKVSSGDKAAAEVRFRVIKSAYDEILKGQAGYSPPPPGTPASSNYARAWYRAHYGGVEPEGPLRCGGPFGGYTTESEFYRAMFRRTRNNPFVLILAGLAAIPLVSAVVKVANGNTEFITRFKNEGIFMFSDNKFTINGVSTVRTNPFSIRNDGEDDVAQSYIYKSEKYKHLRGTMGKTAAGSAATPAGGEGSTVGQSGEGSGSVGSAPAPARAL